MSKNNIDKIMPSKSDLSEKEKLIKLADKDKIKADTLDSLFETLKEKFKKEKKPGENFDSWLRRTPRDELIRINLKSGGDTEKYADLIDAYVKKIDVLQGESLTEYINRIRAAEKKKSK